MYSYKKASNCHLRFIHFTECIIYPNWKKTQGSVVGGQWAKQTDICTRCYEQN